MLIHFRDSSECIHIRKWVCLQSWKGFICLFVCKWYVWTDFWGFFVVAHIKKQLLNRFLVGWKAVAVLCPHSLRDAWPNCACFCFRALYMFGGFDSIMLNDVVRVEVGKSKFKILSKCASVLFSPVLSRPWCWWNMGQVEPGCSLLLFQKVSFDENDNSSDEHLWCQYFMNHSEEHSWGRLGRIRKSKARLGTMLTWHHRNRLSHAGHEIDSAPYSAHWGISVKGYFVVVLGIKKNEVVHSGTGMHVIYIFSSAFPVAQPFAHTDLQSSLIKSNLAFDHMTCCDLAH